MAGFVRVVSRREFSCRRLGRLDYTFLILYCYTTVVFLLRSKNPLPSNVFMAVDPTFCYFIFRGLVSDIDDLQWFLHSFVILLLPYVVLVASEMLTHQNQFLLVGQTVKEMFRDGRPRCMGSFRQPITMGTLGASFIPLYIGLAFNKDMRRRALVGIGLCASIVFFANSGGPLSATLFGLFAWLCWFMRKKMFLIRRGAVGLTIILAMLMKAPIWYLPEKVSNLTGGGGWHRSYLVDQAIRNLDKWWLAGMSIIETRNWFPYKLAVTGGADITNQYLSFGLTAGLGAVGLFVLLLVQAFKSVGRSLTAASTSLEKTSENEYMLWGIGAALFVHVVNFYGVCYFDQIYVVWCMQIAMISSFSQVDYSDIRTSTHEHPSRGQEDNLPYLIHNSFQDQ